MKCATTVYRLIKDSNSIEFDSEKEACEFLGVSRCSVSSCYWKSMRCKGYEIERIGITTHHQTNSRLFEIWEGMRERCTREKHSHYADYGGMGIKICEEWNEFIPFYNWAMDNGYNDNLSIDRINPDGQYEPNNCRWVSMKEQQNNKRSNRFIEYNGENLTLSQWAERLGIGKTTLKERLNNGWSVEKAFTEPIRLRTKGYRPSRIAKREGLN